MLRPADGPVGGPSAGRAGDPRRVVRRGARADVRRAGGRPGEDPGAGLIGVSAGGAGVRLSNSVALGEVLAVVPGRPDGRPVARFSGVVQWCRPLGGGMLAAGLAFDRRLGLAELAGLV